MTTSAVAARPRRTKQDAVAALLLAAIVALLYAAPLRATYYAFDESSYYFPDGYHSILKSVVQPQCAEVLRALPNDLRGLGSSLRALLHMAFGACWELSLYNGRPIALFFWMIYAAIASAAESGLWWVRVLHLAVSCATAAFFFQLLRRTNVATGWAFFLTLLIWSQPVMQVWTAVSLTTPYFLATCCSYVAFTMLAQARGWRATLTHVGLAAALLMIAWLTFQAAPFCGLTLAAFTALRASKDEWPAVRRQCGGFLALLIGTGALFSVGYRLALFLRPAWTLPLVGRAFSLWWKREEWPWIAVPRNYLGPFEWWNYLYPLPMSYERWLWLTSLTAALWLVLLLGALAIETRRSNAALVLQKYGLAVAAVLLTFLPMIAEGFSTRQHVYIACVPTLILVAAHSLSVRLSPLGEGGGSIVPAVAGAALLVVCLGARATFERGLVDPNAGFYSFVGQEVRRQESQPYERVLVINAGHDCAVEPCRGVYGRRMSVGDRPDIVAFYRHIIRGSGARSDVPIEFASAKDVVDKDLTNTLTIDNRRYSRSATDGVPRRAPASDGDLP